MSQMPLSSLQTGDYVAVLVQRLAGTSTLISQPLAKTTIAEWGQMVGSTTPGQAPAWLASYQQGLGSSVSEEQVVVVAHEVGL